MSLPIPDLAPGLFRNTKLIIHANFISYTFVSDFYSNTGYASFVFKIPDIFPSLRRSKVIKLIRQKEKFVVCVIKNSL